MDVRSDLPFVRRVEASVMGTEQNVTYSPRKPSHAPESDGAGSDAGRDRLLVVDDDRTIQALFREVFAPMGIEVATADSGEEALQMLERGGFQVMFLDLNLPGITGVDLCQRIRKDYPFACIHAITGYASLFEFADCRAAGFDDYFTKPFHVTAVVKAVTEAFERIRRWEKLRTTWVV